ncbi:hypothetical protein AJ79_05298 [Helicocarpus griseus UAMH5409]|uniref:Rhodopsin domain-containing protein n=1 Tax=Helicocarpus griseus UAMH5409 TaxID=1447875 RepID=A0A2B7XQD1_9EURO|nr:hypothetical protein AJ79_05298 [Helicocarpus griseus UAMH5409]
MSANESAMDPLPPGVIPNFENPKDNLNTVLIVTQIICIAFVTIFLGLRIYVRLAILKTFGREDWTCIVSWILCLGYCTTGIFMAKNGGGYDQWDIRKTALPGYLKTGYAATVIYMPMAFLVKLALLMIIARVFSPHKKAVIGIYVFLALLFGYYASGFVIKARPCDPVPAYWLAANGDCLNQATILMCDSIVSVVSDLIILFLPLPLVWSLQMETKKKLRVMAIMGAGGLATAFSIYRLALVIISGATGNQVMFFTRVVLSGNAEIGIGLICACLPALNALIERKRKEYSSRRHGESGGYDYQLSKVQNNSRVSRTAPKVTPEVDSDKDCLISYPQGKGFESSINNDTNSTDHSIRVSPDRSGILKTVDVSHTYEMK